MPNIQTHPQTGVGGLGGPLPRRDARKERDLRLIARKLGLYEARAAAEFGEEPSPRADAIRVTPSAPLITVDDDVAWCLVIPDAPGGQLSNHDLDAIAAGRLIADTQGGGVIVCAPSLAGNWQSRGADRVILYDYAEGCDDHYRIALIERAIADYRPAHILFPDTATAGGHLARSIAARGNLSIATQVKRIEEQSVVRTSDNAQMDQWLKIPQVIAVLQEVAELNTSQCREARVLPCPAVDFQSPLEVGESLPPDSLTAPLAEAQFIVSAGTGVRDLDALKRLASKLGAGLGATRAVCDTGLIPRDRQIGISGTLVRPRCYLSFGISGASQHLQGIAGCERVVAVNVDLHADMVKRSDLAFIIDAHPVIHELLNLLDQ